MFANKRLEIYSQSTHPFGFTCNPGCFPSLPKHSSVTLSWTIKGIFNLQSLSRKTLMQFLALKLSICKVGQDIVAAILKRWVMYALSCNKSYNISSASLSHASFVPIWIIRREGFLSINASKWSYKSCITAPGNAQIFIDPSLLSLFSWIPLKTLSPIINVVFDCPRSYFLNSRWEHNTYFHYYRNTGFYQVSLQADQRLKWGERFELIGYRNDFTPILRLGSVFYFNIILWRDSRILWCS